MHSLFKFIDLRADRPAADDTDAAAHRRIAQPFAFDGDLLAEFARGGEHEGLDSAVLEVQSFEQR